MIDPRYARVIHIGLVLSLFVALACSLVDLAVSPAATELSSTGAQATFQSVATTPGPILPTQTPLPKPSSTPAPPSLGSSRSNPFPASGVAAVPGWEFQVVEMKRGEEAWAVLQETGYGSNPSADPGNEYILIRLKVKSTHTDGQQHDLEPWWFYVTGDGAVVRPEEDLVMGPDPQLELTLDAGGETEGWMIFQVGIGEGNLMLVRREFDAQMESAWYYLALEPGAVIAVPDELANVFPDKLGLTPDAPAPAQQSVTTDRWQVTVLEAKRGESARLMMVHRWDQNPALADNMDYVALWIKVRNLSINESPEWIGRGFFKMVDSSNREYDHPEKMLEPEPALSIDLAPGGEFEGWVILQVPAGDSNVALLFTPQNERGVQRYLSIDVPDSAGIRLRIGHFWLGPALVETRMIYESLTGPSEPALEGEKFIVIRLDVLYLEPGETFQSLFCYLISSSGREYKEPLVQTPFDWAGQEIIAKSISVNKPLQDLVLYFSVDVSEELAAFLMAYF